MHKTQTRCCPKSHLTQFFNDLYIHADVVLFKRNFKHPQKKKKKKSATAKYNKSSTKLMTDILLSAQQD